MKRGGYSDIFHIYIGSGNFFFWFKILNLTIFFFFFFFFGGGGSENEYLLVYEDFVDILGGVITKLNYI